MKAIKTALAVFCLTATSAYAATFNLTSTGTISSPLAGSSIPIGAAYSLNASFDPVDGTLNSSVALPYLNVIGTLDIAGVGPLSFSSARRVGFGSGGLGILFEDPGLNPPGITGFSVQFSDAISPIGRSHVEFLRSISDSEISLISVSERIGGSGATYFLNRTSTSFGEAVAPAPVPLPATGAMLVGALGLLGWRARRRARV